MNTTRTTGKPSMGCLTRLLLFLVLGAVTLLLINAVFAPWSFFMGGRFHTIPMWQGWGRIHAPAGDYLLFVRMEPRRGSRGIAHVGGIGVLCTPRGETFNLTMGADFEKHMGLGTDGKRVYMYLHKKPGYFSRSAGDTRPRLTFMGAWRNPDIVLDDHGSLAREFLADGTLYNAGLHKPLAAPGVLPLTLKEGSRSDFDAACKAAKP